MEKEIQVSSVFFKNKNAKTRIIVNEGSSRSTKTYSIIQLLIYKAKEKKRKIDIMRAKKTWLSATTILDFIDIMDSHFGGYRKENHNLTKDIYTFPETGSTIHFIGLDESQKLHGMKRDILYINEAIEANKKSYTQLMIRTSEQVILDYNPSTDTHWIYDTVITRDDCTFIKSTYKDNPFLSKEIREEIERLEPTPANIRQGTADETSWKIYGLGERASQTGLIFGDFGLVDKVPDHYKMQWYGLDFGYTNDPTALIQITLSEGALYFHQMIYERGLTNIKNPMKPGQKNIQSRFEALGINNNHIIWADQAEPKSIQDLLNCGFNIRAAPKGKDSIINGIDKIKSYPCFITNSSVDLIKERNNYKWAENKAGEALNVPVDAFNHGWDASRYGVTGQLGMIGKVPSITRL